jgi:nucleobase:cation symporter-1, NCS1 family
MVSKISKIQDMARVKNSPTNVPTSTVLLANPDLVPVRPEQRLWTAKNYFFFWWADGCNLNTFQIAATSIVAGLAWWQAWLAVIVGYSIVAIFTVINARGPAVYHVGFPVICRSSFGLWGSFWPVLQRAVMACVWQGVQAYLGGMVSRSRLFL